LSQGRVDPQTGCIECPYHGWQFNSTGTYKCIYTLLYN
jgi:phenylpropionate dioxygenase-like ring-hydroxylating dioxygenase large terminal subunit